MQNLCWTALKVLRNQTSKQSSKRLTKPTNIPEKQGCLENHLESGMTIS